jgi:hypothetical protein
MLAQLSLAQRLLVLAAAIETEGAAVNPRYARKLLEDAADKLVEYERQLTRNLA